MSFSDVNLSAPSSGQVLGYSGNLWKNNKNARLLIDKILSNKATLEELNLAFSSIFFYLEDNSFITANEEDRTYMIKTLKDIQQGYDDYAFYEVFNQKSKFDVC